MAPQPEHSGESVASGKGGPAAPDPARAVLNLVHPHLPLALTATVFALVFLRLLRVSNFDTITFRAVLANAGPTEVILGTIVQIFPPFLTALLILFGATLPVLLRRYPPIPRELFHQKPPLSSSLAPVVWVLVLFVVSVPLFTAPRIMFWVILGISAVIAVRAEILIRRLSAPPDPSGSDLTRRASEVGAMAVVAILYAFMTFDEPWLPAEAIELRGQDMLVGYVLDQREAELVVLRDEDREVIRVDLDDVKSREICRADPASRAVINIGADYEECPN